MRTMILKFRFSTKNRVPGDAFLQTLVGIAKNPTIVGIPGKRYESRIFPFCQKPTIHLSYIHIPNRVSWSKSGVSYCCSFP